VQETKMIHFHTRTLIVANVNVVKTITQLHNS
jgi:hypothetical protein